MTEPLSLEMAIATHDKAWMPAVSSVVEYDQCHMEWRVLTHDGRKLKYAGELESHLPNGWPLLSLKGRMDRTLVVQPERFKPL